MRSLSRRVALLAALFSLAGAAPALADRYVALGDSYSSGVGTRTYYDSDCQRSVYAYPQLLAQQRPNTQLTDVACSGATTSNVLSSQVQSLTSATSIATITVGGNDADFSGVITECAKPAWASDCAAKVDGARSFISNTLPGRLDSVYAQIKQRAPAAKVVVLGYPRLFNGEDCNAGTFFSPDDESRLNGTADLLRDVTKAQVAKYGANFTFKDAIGPFIGHAVCGDEWLNGLSNPVSESYHPNRDGQRLGYLPLVRSVVG